MGSFLALFWGQESQSSIQSLGTFRLGSPHCEKATEWVNENIVNLPCTKIDLVKMLEAYHQSENKKFLKDKPSIHDYHYTPNSTTSNTDSFKYKEYSEALNEWISNYLNN